MGKTFMALSSHRLAALINAAQRHVAVVAPSIHLEVGDALVKAVRRLGGTSVDVVVDVDEKVFRLGYGSIDALKVLKEAGVRVRNHPGLRIGLAIVDDDAWVFSPIALYIETEPSADEFPNAVALSEEEALRLLLRVSEKGRSEVIKEAADPELVEEARATVVELSCFVDNGGKLAEVAKSLEEAPPVCFDVSRQVQVFEPYIQYVDLKLQGCSIQRHKIQLPPSILGLASNRDFEERLSTTFNLIEKSSSVSAKHLDDAVRKLRESFTRSLGKLGRVLLKSQRNNFDAEIDALRDHISAHRDRVGADLGKELENTRVQLVENFLPHVIERPPKELRYQITTSSLTEDQARRWLDAEIARCMPEADKVITRMDLECIFKDVTYETLREANLAEVLKKEFPLVDWDKPFAEFTAAEEAR